MTNLFTPLIIKNLTLKNRVVMAPLTRSRAGVERIPNQLMTEYYVQRANAGLILSEAIAITPKAVGYANTPGLWSDVQVEGWAKLNAAVHAAGSKIFAQLWHVGRISDPSLIDGDTPVAPTAIAAKGHVSLLRPERPYPVPRALTLEEITQIIADYKKAAINAKTAGFDGVLIHAANGYLIDQFLQDSTNKRDDIYGGSIENRVRLLLEVTDAAIDVFGADCVAVHLSPRGDAHDMGDSDPKALFTYVADKLGLRQIAFISAREYLAADSLGAEIKRVFGGVYIANQGFNKDTANELIASGGADAVAFGVPYIANPDLVARFEKNASLNAPRPQFFYSAGAEGYTDYPALES